MSKRTNPEERRQSIAKNPRNGARPRVWPLTRAFVSLGLLIGTMCICFSTLGAVASSLAEAPASAAVLLTPTITTMAPAAVINVGSTLTDSITVKGTGGASIAGTWSILGPISVGSDGTCGTANWASAQLFANGSISVNGDGTFPAAPSFAASQGGCYTFDVSLPATATTVLVTSGPGNATETTLVNPTLATSAAYSSTPATPSSPPPAINPALKLLSPRLVAPASIGDFLSDDVVLIGTGDGYDGNDYTGPLTWDIVGPVSVGTDGTCGTSLWTGAQTFDSGSVAVVGDGTYVVASVKAITTPGCYSFVDALTAAGTIPKVTTEVGLASETVLATGVPSILVTKTADPSTFKTAGETITYSYAVENNGNEVLSDIGVTDPMVGLSSVTCPIPSLSPAQSEICHATYTTTQSDVDLGVLTNVGTAIGTPPAGASVTATSKLSIPGTSLPLINLVKTANITQYQASGTLTTYSYAVTNSGNVTLNPVNVTDPMPGLSAVVCPDSSLAPLQSQICHATYTTTQADVDVGSLNNTGTTIGTPPTGPAVSATSKVSIPALTAPGIELSKTASIASYSVPGTPVTYSYLVTNSGDVTLDPVVVTDPMARLSAIVCPRLSLAPDQTETCSATFTTDQGDVDSGSLNNTGTAVGTPPTGPAVSVTSKLSIPSTGTPKIVMVKSSNVASYSAPGTVITYDYTVTNDGNDTLDPVTVSDPMAGLGAVVCPGESLAPAQSETCHATYTTSQGDLDSGSLNNTGSATGTPPSGPQISATSSVSIPAVTKPGIEIAKSSNVASFSVPGTVVTYSYTVTNDGNVTLNPVSVSDPMKGLGPVVCADASLAPTQSETCQATYTTTTSDVAAGSIANTGTASGTPPSGPPVTAVSKLSIPLVAPVVQAPFTPVVTTTSTLADATVNAQLADQIVISGDDPAVATATGTWSLYGPANPGGDTTCATTSWVGVKIAASGSFSVALVSGSGSTTTPETVVSSIGCYTFVETVAAGAHALAASTPEGSSSETVQVATHTPAIVTTTSLRSAIVGATLTDTVDVSGTQGADVVGSWALLGPTTVGADGTCATAAWGSSSTYDNGTMAISGDGTLTTNATKPIENPGCYTFVETLPATSTTSLVTTPSGLAAETTLVMSTPTPAAATPSVAGSTPAPLAFTGFSLARDLEVAAALVVVGILVILLRRRRRNITT